MSATSASRLCCVFGTDTEVGKTHVTAALLRALTTRGIFAQALKAVQSGCMLSPKGTLLSTDQAIYLEAAPQAPSKALVLLRTPCSPDLAARLECRKLRIALLRARIIRAAKKTNITLVEGSGGLFTPLNRKETLLDLFAGPDASALQAAPILLVAANRLGCINHTLLSLEALRARSLSVTAVVLNCPAPLPPGTLEGRIAEDNAVVIARMGKVCVFSLPYCAALGKGGLPARQAWDQLARLLDPLARKISRSE